MLVHAPSAQVTFTRDSTTLDCTGASGRVTVASLLRGQHSTNVQGTFHYE